MLHRPYKFTKAQLLDAIRDCGPDAIIQVDVCMKSHEGAPGSTQAAQELGVLTYRRTLGGEEAITLVATVWTSDLY